MTFWVLISASRVALLLSVKISTCSRNLNIFCLVKHTTRPLASVTVAWLARERILKESFRGHWRPAICLAMSSVAGTAEVWGAR